MLLFIRMDPEFSISCPFALKAGSLLHPPPGGRRGKILLGIFGGLVQFLENVSHVDMMDIRAMLQGFVIGNLAFKTGQFVFFENRKRLGITSDYITNDHIFVNHAGSLQQRCNNPVKFIVRPGRCTLMSAQSASTARLCYCRFLIAASIRSIPFRMFSMLTA